MIPTVCTKQETGNLMELANYCLLAAYILYRILAFPFGGNVSTAVSGRDNEQRNQLKETQQNLRNQALEAEAIKTSFSNRQRIERRYDEMDDDTDKETSFALHSTPSLTILIHDCRLNLPASKHYINSSLLTSMGLFKCPSIECCLYSQLSPIKHSEIDGPFNQTPS